MIDLIVDILSWALLLLGSGFVIVGGDRRLATAEFLHANARGEFNRHHGHNINYCWGYASSRLVTGNN